VLLISTRALCIVHRWRLFAP
ncbi:hypothetical protein AB1N83_014065, partial [Pleurotus pulmonarius]